MPDVTTRLEEFKTALTGPSSTLYSAQQYAGNQVRESTKVALGRLTEAHLLATGVLGGLLVRTHGKNAPDGELPQERRVLFASFVVGMPLVERAIEEGRYLQAYTLIRQEMETLAQIVASHAGKRRQGKQVTVALLGKDIARAYGDLSAAAHASNHDMASGLLTGVVETEEAVSRTTYFYPVFNKKLARQAFTLHLVLTMNLIGQVGIDYNKAHPSLRFGPADTEALNLALELMKAEGVVEPEPTKTSLGS